MVDIRRLVYSPKAYAFVRTDDHPQGVNISEWIVRGQVHRLTNAASTATVELRNPAKMWTQPGKPFFRPMDPITIFLTRLKDRPVQVFTGYLDQTPYLQLFPGTVTLNATCTLKRLMHTYWDPSLPYVFDGFLREYGWNLDPKTGQMFSNNLYDGPTLDQAGRQMNDGSLGALLFATMKHVARWNSSELYIENLPKGIVDKVSSIYNSLASENEGIQENIKTLLTTMLGVDAMGSGGGPLGQAPALGKDGKYSVADLVHLAEAVGLRGEEAAIAGAIAMAESGGDPKIINGIGCVGLWQIYQRVHPDLGTVAELQDPTTNAKAMKSIHTSSGDWNDWTTYTGADTPGHEKTYLRHLAEARKAVSPSGSEPTLTSWKQRNHNDSRAKTDAVSKNTGSAAPKNTANPDAGLHGGKDYGGTTQTTRWDALLAEANRIHKVHQFYKFGGGHGAGNVPKQGPWDCSAAICGLLQAIGYNVPNTNTVGLYPILTPGAGKRITIYDRDDHTFAVIDGKRWGAESGQYTGWLTAPMPSDISTYRKFTVPGGESTLDEPASLPANADTSTPGGGGGQGGTDTGNSVGGNQNASAFAAYLNLPGALDVAEAIGLAGQKSLLNDQPLFPFIQQLCQSTLRSFQSMPNGNFFAFFPDYFGGFGHRTPYWLIDDVEILDGGIDLTDEYLATHVFIVGDTAPPYFNGSIDTLDRLQSAGVMDIESAFKASFLGKPKAGEIGGLGVTHEMSRHDVLKFLQKYGARPYKEELPMIRNPFYEAFLSYQKFMELWSKQFATKFQFTFMPELYPGGLVGLNDHGIQCYVEEVVHTFDYEGGFTTEAVLSSPAAMAHGPESDISAGMIRAFDFTTDHQSKPQKTKAVAPPRVDGPFGGPHWTWGGRK